MVRAGNARWQGLQVIIATLAGALLLSCAPAAPPAGVGSSSGAASTTSRQPKVLRIGLQPDRELPSPAMFGSSGSGSSALEGYFVFHAGLTVYDAAGSPVSSSLA